MEENILGWDVHAVLLHGLLDTSRCGRTAGDDPDADLVLPVLGDRLVHWEQYMASTSLPEDVLPIAEWAVLHAFRGDVRAAWTIASRTRSPEARAAALAALATYLAGATVIVPAADGWMSQHTSVRRYLALADVLRADASRDKGEAGRLVREVLVSEHWWYALPLLPRLAPEAVPQLAKSALVHVSGRR
ncbi:hypothetical protein [Streptomyces sp. NPDC059863]|uniref:hypothetical protein n=1 Tax=unclassified Streptomyces TaxID=2593676 RepID=UPI00364D4208